MKTSIFGTMFRIVGFVLVGAMVIGLAGCGGGADGDPTVTSITVTAAGNATSVDLGDELQFSATVNGSNSPPQGVEWSIETTGIKPGTTIDQNGLLTVADDETVSLLTVEAKSTFDTSKSGFAIVTVRDSSLTDLEGDITISPTGPVTTGTELTATYTGSETVYYQWYIGDYNVGPNSNKYTPYEAGSYTVMVSAAGYNKKISAAVTVTGSVIPPENLPVADRWRKWVDETSTATLEYSVAADGVCTITVGGTPDDEWGGGKANAGYRHSANVNTPYEYEFEAWTESGDRTLGVQYYVDADEDVFLSSYINITSTPTTYTVKGQRTQKSGVQFLEFMCADQLGTFYVKILSIEPYTPELEYELIPEYGEWGQYNVNHGTYRVSSGTGLDGTVTIQTKYNNVDVTEIGEGAFQHNKSITSVSIPASVKVIGRSAFDGCNKLETVTFASGSQLEKIGGYAFAWSGLTSITIPASVNYIESGVFASCANLSNITVASGNTNYSSANGILYNIDKTELIAAPGAISGTVTIPATVKRIGSEAFRNCESLAGVTFAAGSQLEGIGFWAFAWCPNITSITIPATVTSIEGGAFWDWTSSQTIYIEGHADRQSTIAAGWDEEVAWLGAWDGYCDANIIYQGQ